MSPEKHKRAAFHNIIKNGDQVFLVKIQSLRREPSESILLNKETEVQIGYYVGHLTFL